MGILICGSGLRGDDLRLRGEHLNSGSNRERGVGDWGKREICSEAAASAAATSDCRAST